MKSKKKPVKPAPKLSASEALLTLDVKRDGLEAVFGAAYLMMDKAYVSLSGDRAGKIGVLLRAKDPRSVKPKALAEEFLSDLESQKVRWAVAKTNLPIREYIAEQAVLLANGALPAPAPEAAAEELTAEQRAEIEKLISEVESEIKSMNDKKVAADPKGIKASWEERQEQGNKAGL